MLGIVLSPDLPSTMFNALAIRMGVAWYLPLAYGCSSVVAAALANYAIRRGWFKRLAYFVALGYLLLIVTYNATLYHLWDLGQLTGSHCPALVTSIQITGFLLAVSLVLLHQRVFWSEL